MIRCLICESKAILTRDVAKGIALLVSLADSALQGLRRRTQIPQPWGRQISLRRVQVFVPALWIAVR
ncbi:hypothetical protein [Pseudomonas luteola]|uniref:hypothetical protein n=1 Tax=Pseudomonas luteola TaxID=47886 RepID=UPI0021ADE255|nr:hypothetical protein [Pseudomonas luteola]